MKKRIVIPLLALLAVGIMIAVKGFSVLRESGSKVDALVYADIDMSRLSDGVYTGSCDGGLVNAEARVEVKDHKIADIELVKHDHLKGKPAEAILDDMIRQNTDDVDAVSGATISSKVIRNAVNSALQNGLDSGEKLPESDDPPEATDPQPEKETTSVKQAEEITNQYKLPEKGSGGSIIASGESIAVSEGIECVSLSEEPNAEFLFSSGVALRNLQFVSLSFDGERYKREAFIHTIYDFPAETVIKVSTHIPELYSNLLLQYEDPTGAFHSFFVLYDMSAGQPTVVLKDAMDTEIEW